MEQKVRSITTEALKAISKEKKRLQDDETLGIQTDEIFCN